jgi:hypothetical protein
LSTHLRLGLPSGHFSSDIPTNACQWTYQQPFLIFSYLYNLLLGFNTGNTHMLTRSSVSTLSMKL